MLLLSIILGIAATFFIAFNYVQLYKAFKSCNEEVQFGKREFAARDIKKRTIFLSIILISFICISLTGVFSKPYVLIACLLCLIAILVDRMVRDYRNLK